MMQRQERQRDPDGDFGRDGLEYARPALTRARARDGLRNEGGHGNGGCWNHRGICWSMDVRCRDSWYGRYSLSLSHTLILSHSLSLSLCVDGGGRVELESLT
ncbi:hypothetical protein D8B26_000049 [Coccidioides posadasii str. Silveira]|uniref:uncharacterized protein n=1 Tax=Coccidioides posadasii (strain RMSCC 757 / Silveira) TaxID=443226 RepID=UPI001BF06E76|nr:hypothetical protein D8B26_000049 [Coccidioides posadasii str. Silveira]